MSRFLVACSLVGLCAGCYSPPSGLWEFEDVEELDSCRLRPASAFSMEMEISVGEVVLEDGSSDGMVADRRGNAFDFSEVERETFEACRLYLGYWVEGEFTSDETAEMRLGWTIGKAEDSYCSDVFVRVDGVSIDLPCETWVAYDGVFADEVESSQHAVLSERSAVDWSELQIAARSGVDEVSSPR